VQGLGDDDEDETHSESDNQKEASEPSIRDESEDTAGRKQERHDDRDEFACLNRPRPGELEGHFVPVSTDHRCVLGRSSTPLLVNQVNRR
jgi:hypothetical protein